MKAVEWSEDWEPDDSSVYVPTWLDGWAEGRRKESVSGLTHKGVGRKQGVVILTRVGFTTPRFVSAHSSG